MFSKFLFVVMILAQFTFGARAVHAADGRGGFSTGPVFEDFGPTAEIDADFALGPNAEIAILFDTSRGSELGKLNKTFETAARFMNMHVKAGVPRENLKAAIVLHGKAIFDIVNDDAYGKKFEGAENPNVSILKAFDAEGIRVIVCGQSAAYYGVSKSDFLPGVEMALSAMTAHALLQQEGYTLNPF